MTTSRFSIRTLIAAGLCLMVPFAFAAEDVQTQDPFASVAADAGSEATLWRLVLSGGWPGGKPLQVSIWCRDGVFGQAWAETSGAPAYAFVATAGHGAYFGMVDAGLRHDKGQVAGLLRVGHGRTYQIKGRVTGGAIQGSYEATFGSGKDGKSATGKLQGQILKVSELKKLQTAFPEACAYPGWRNDGSGSGASTGQKLVDDPCAVRVAWKSEALIPAGYYEGENIGEPFCDIQSGHTSPILADGRLYVSYFVGNGSEIAKDKGKVMADCESGGRKGQYKPVPMHWWKRKFAAKADQIITCIDAQTGATLWRTVIPVDGPNISAHGRVGALGPNSKASSHLGPCAGGGAVFAKGTGGKLYCVDAVTGKMKWTVPVSGPHKQSKSADADTCQYARGVVVAGRGRTLVGFAAATGKELWQVEDALTFRGASALRWLAEDGKAYFLTGAGHCIDPQSGKVMWQIPDLKLQSFAADPQHFLAASADGFHCWRISPKGFTALWTHDAYGADRNQYPVLYDGNAYVRAVKKPIPPKNKDWLTICLSLKDGSLAGTASGTKSYSSNVAGDGRIFNCNASVVLLQKAAPDYRDLPPHGATQRGKVADQNTAVILQGSPESTAIYADGRLFSRTFDGIVCYDCRVP